MLSPKNNLRTMCKKQLTVKGNYYYTLNGTNSGCFKRTWAIFQTRHTERLMTIMPFIHLKRSLLSEAKRWQNHWLYPHGEFPKTFYKNSC